ncbi:hypothetical protein CAPN006_18550, partial [Capnocytophaga canimorsus]
YSHSNGCGKSSRFGGSSR